MLKLSVGYQFNENYPFSSIVKTYAQNIEEVYFVWTDMPSGRSIIGGYDGYFDYNLQNILVEELKTIKQMGIKLNLLFNANCYGSNSQSREFFINVGNTIDYVKNCFGLKSVTTTSPLIAKFIKNNFEGLEVRASVNMEIGSVEGMKYIAEYFDSFYMKRELNKDFDAIKNLHAWCGKNEKTLYMLANSGCLNNCSVHNFHDNLVAHENEIAKMDNAYNFGGICKEFLKKEENYTALIENTNFVRPEDVYKYEPYFKAMKLATRVNPNPVRILESYIKRSYSGNILELLEPAHNIYPYIIENGEPLKLKKLDTDIAFLE